MDESKSETGKRVEDLAVQYLSQRPIRLIARNYRLKLGEIDLILEETMPNGQVELVFVEVRFRRQGGWVSGIESVGPGKRLRLENSARRFLGAYRGPASGVRFDILAWDGASWTHLRNAWFALS